MVFFFSSRRRHTRCSRDWSSDVCSSDLLREMPQAEQEYREAWLQRPDIPGLQLELGLVYAGTEQWDKAEEAFRAEANRQPGNAEAAYRLGTALLQRGKAQEARAELQRADKLQPDMPETLYSLGKAALLAGEFALAEKSWTRVVALEKETRSEEHTSELQSRLHLVCRL